MGKQRRQRKKLHLEAKDKPLHLTNPEENFTETETSLPLLIEPQSNIFEGLKIDIASLNKNLNEDLQSVKSFKSVKSELGKNVLSKKDKLKLRREMFLKKFETMSQMEKEKKLQEKRKKAVITGDMNPLHDALPSLESLLKNRTDIPYKQNPESKKLKGIEKTRKQKRTQLQGIKIYQQILKNKQYQKDPFDAVSQHLKAVLDHEQS